MRSSSAWRGASVSCAANSLAAYGLGADEHGRQLLLFGVGSRIVQVIQALQTALYVLLEIPQAPAVNLVVQDGVAGGALLHELGEDARFVGSLPLGRHFTEDEVAHGLTLPEGDNLLGVNLPGLGADGEGDFLA